MKHHLFLAAMLIACTVHAGTEVNQCITPAGQVTLTDEPCPAGEHTIKVSVGVADSGVMAATRKGKRGPAPFMAARRVYPPSNGLPRDVVTIKAAHAHSMLLSAR
ncbi:MAG: DUF4124 domain-containing protein [Pseudomonadota bacterium]